MNNLTMENNMKPKYQMYYRNEKKVYEIFNTQDRTSIFFKEEDCKRAIEVYKKLNSQPIIKKPFKGIKKFTEYFNGKTKDLFKIWFLDNTTEVRDSDNNVVMSSKIMEKK